MQRKCETKEAETLATKAARQLPERVDPPAQLKLLALLKAAEEEAFALLEAHGDPCNCGPCCDAQGFVWCLQMAYSGLESDQTCWSRREVVEVEQLREYLATRFGDSAEPGNARYLKMDRDGNMVLADETFPPSELHPSEPGYEPAEAAAEPQAVKFREWL